MRGAWFFWYHRPVSALSEDQDLVETALGGELPARRALAARLLRTIQCEVVAVLRRRAAAQARDPRQEVQDMIQDVLVSLFENDGRELRRWDPARGRSLDSFVRLVARRRTARILGQRRGNPWADAPVDPQDLDVDDGDRALVQRLEQRNALAGLLDALYEQMSARDLELFDLLFLEEMDPQEVADVMGMSRGAVNAWSYRMRKVARSLVAEKSPAGASSAEVAATTEAMGHD